MEYDVTFIRGSVTIWTRGQFEKWGQLSLAPPKDTVVIGRYRFYKDELENPAIQTFISKHYPIKKEEV